MERLYREMRALVPQEYELDISLSESPVEQAWIGARDWASQRPFTEWSVTRDEWESSQKRKPWLKLLSSKGGALV